MTRTRVVTVSLLLCLLCGKAKAAAVQSGTEPRRLVAVFFDWSLLYIQRPTLLGSVEDHVPTRYFILQHGEDGVLPALRAPR